ncbi:hypothetical protein ACQP1K_13845 [Sphaerimonospora sp. CA-214678]|uniref:hypothetical protein n=1 Tax=Sphaerimonospora sp. CA-214678 TaxID=3240029 RepID=UPI003D949FA3
MGDDHRDEVARRRQGRWRRPYAAARHPTRRTRRVAKPYGTPRRARRGSLGPMADPCDARRRNSLRRLVALWVTMTLMFRHALLTTPATAGAFERVLDGLER